VRLMPRTRSMIKYGGAAMGRDGFREFFALDV
jgi:hypothetical protein